MLRVAETKSSGREKEKWPKFTAPPFSSDFFGIIEFQ